MTHRRVVERPHRDGAPSTVAAVAVTMTRAGVRILDEVSVTAHAGRVLALMGPSGSGKSSLLSIVAGLETPDGGRIERDGVAVGPGVPATYGLVLQGYGLASVLTAAENIEIALQTRGLTRQQVAERAAAALDSVHLTPVAGHLVEELSGGQQQRVAIARALAIEPAVVLADEPTAELDHDTRNLILERLVGLAELGAVVMVATHDPAVAEMADDVVHLVDGRVAGSSAHGAGGAAPSSVHGAGGAAGAVNPSANYGPLT